GQLLERHFRERYGDVNVQAQSPVVQSMNPTALTKHLDHVVQSYRPAYSLIVVADAAGKLVAAHTVDGAGQPGPRGRLRGRSLGGSRTAVVEDLHEDPVLRALYGPGAQSWAVTFTMPVERNGRVVGAIRMFCDQRAVQEIAAGVEAGARANGYTAADIHLINADEKSIDTMRSLAGNEIAAAAQKVKAIGYLRGAGLSGEGDVVAGYYRTRGDGAFPGLGWSVIASEPTRAVKTAMRGTVQLTLIVALLVALVLVFVAVFIA